MPGDNLESLVGTIEQFGTWSHTDRLRLFAWFLHKGRNVRRFSASDLRRSFDELHLPRPANLSQLVANLKSKDPPELLEDGHGLYLARDAMVRMDERFGRRPITLAVDHLLAEELPSKVGDLSERVFLEEAILCLRAGAFRAAIVMTWNLAFDHLCRFVLASHLDAFNTQWPISYAKRNRDARVQAIRNFDDFAELKESEVIQVAKSAAIISADVARILDEKLQRRNSAAHPAQVTFSQLQAESYVDDLVRNVVLRLA